MPENTLNQQINNSRSKREIPGHLILLFQDKEGELLSSETLKSIEYPQGSNNYYHRVWSNKCLLPGMILGITSPNPQSIALKNPNILNNLIKYFK